MYHIDFQYNHWQIYKENEFILCGIGSVESAFAIAKLNGIFLTIENLSILERVA